MVITHLDGVDNLPLMYGAPKTCAAMSIDNRNYLLYCNGYNKTLRIDATHDNFSDFSWSKEFWADVAVFSIRGRDVLDDETGWRRWNMNLVSARAKTKWVAVRDTVL
jgi:hypothetical protein